MEASNCAIALERLEPVVHFYATSGADSTIAIRATRGAESRYPLDARVLRRRPLARYYRSDAG